MKGLHLLLGLWIFAKFTAPELSSAAAEPPVRLAVIVEAEPAAAAADLLTAELSKKDILQLLERQEIQRIYREQTLSSVNKDYIKLGQLLGADGLLFLQIASEATNELLQAQLVAVKPGVVIGESRAAWPLKENLEWAKFTAGHFAPLYPKLAVLARAALPISMVNIRAASKSKAEQELERELTLMLTARLVHEPELFVLERRRMGTLAEETELRGMPESAFWNGSYLVEGALDRDGFSAEQATIHARLMPARGPAIEVHVAGRRNDPTALVEQLTDQILRALQRKRSAAGWNPNEEASRYLEESTWQLKYGTVREAQVAAETAWALGRRDLPCASARVNALLLQARPDTGGYKQGIVINQTGDDSETDSSIRELVERYRGDLFVRRASNTVEYAFVTKPPQAAEIEPARQTLELYTQLGALVVPSDPQSYARWYGLGISALEAASQVLQHFSIVPGAQQSVVDDLVRLRAQTRQTAEWIAQYQSRFTNFGPANLILAPDTPSPRMRLASNLLFCQADWGCFWQDQPEAAIALYRNLLKTPAAEYCRSNLLQRELTRPRLVAWNEQDRQRLPSLTESLLQEVRAFRFPAISPPRRDYPPRRPVEGPQVTFAAQMDYLRTNGPSERDSFDLVFPIMKAYTREEALQLLPFAVAYRSNLLSAVAQGRVANQAEAISRVELLKNHLDRFSGSTPPPKPFLRPSSAVAQPKPQASGYSAGPNTNCILVNRFLQPPKPLFELGEPKEDFQEWEVVSHWWYGDRLWLDVRYDWTYVRYTETGSGWVTTNCAAVAILDPRAGTWEVIQYPASTATAMEPHVSVPGVSHLAPGFGELERRGDSGAVLDGALYVSGWNSLKKYDLETKQWQTLPVPWQIPTKLFVIRDHLLAANREAIFELKDSGREVKILASVRRRPGLTALDSLDSLEVLAMFPGPGDSVRAIVAKNIYSWDGQDWKKLTSMAQYQRPVVCDGAALFKSSLEGEVPGLWLLRDSAGGPEFCLAGASRRISPPAYAMSQPPPPPPPSPPTWRSPRELRLVETALTLAGSNIVLFAESAEPTRQKQGPSNVSWIIGEVEGRNADLLYLQRGRTNAIMVPLKFDLSRGDFFSKISDSHFDDPRRHDLTWLVSTTDFLFLGQNNLRGVWAIPMTELEAAIAREKANQLPDASPGGGT
jgi:hypothetical protein